ncbi:MAG: AmpG family muropeptide MFS transporter, partial [bacterium]|nr:AmpG family muropeptide MFS transporter [bacterium]
MQKENKIKKFIWVISTYFAEGFPYSIVRQISSVFFKDNGASLQAIGLTSLYGLPWVLKFLWAPFVDEFSTKRKWLLFMEICLTGAVFLIALGSTLPNSLPVVAFLFLIVAIFSATHDISIDGFYLENMNRDEQAKYVGFQAMSYRIALIAGGGGIVLISGLTSWWAAFLLAAIILGGLLAFHSVFLPNIEKERKKASEMLLFLKKKRIWLGIVLIGVSAFL